MSKKLNESKKKIQKNLKEDILSKKLIFICIFGIILGSFIIRVIYYPFGIPFTLDNLGYFLYAYDTSIQGSLPIDYSPANNGWSAFVALFFSLAKVDDPFFYMDLQRMISLSISTLTTIPVFLLCRKFFSNSLSLIGASLFAFEPRLIANSLLGVTEPLYIFLLTVTILLFLSQKEKLVFGSFAMAAFTAMVRAEGIMVFFIISILFFIKNKKSIKSISKYVLALSIFILILYPMIIYKQEIDGDDRIFGRVQEAVSEKSNIGFFEQNKTNDRIFNGIQNFVKFFVWDLIPIFIIFIPIGIIFFFYSFDFKKLVILFTLIGLAIPAFYAYSLSSEETRYLFPLYSMLCIISLFGIEKILEKSKKKKTILFLIIIGIIASSNVFLDIKKIDYEHEKDAFTVAKYVVSNTKGVNLYSPDSQYTKAAEVIENWPILPNHTSDGHFDGKTIKLSLEGFENLDEFIIENKDKGLTHLVIDNNPSRPKFLQDVFMNENKSYLKKEFDFEQNDYHVKIFRINFDEFESLEKK